MDGEKKKEEINQAARRQRRGDKEAKIRERLRRMAAGGGSAVASFLKLGPSQWGFGAGTAKVSGCGERPKRRGGATTVVVEADGRAPWVRVQRCGLLLQLPAEHR